MNTKFADTVLRMMFIFVFVMGTVWMPTTSAGASPPLAMGDGLYAEYRELGGSTVILTVDGEGPINNGWNDSCPDTNMYQNACGSWAGMFNSWSLLEETLTGFIEAPVTGTYEFHSWIDDYLEITINGVTQIADDIGGASYSIVINLVEGQFYPITMNYKNRMGSANISLFWTLPDSTFEIVPKQYLYTEIPQTPELTLEKSASPTTYNQVGDVIDYSYLLTNTGSGTLSGPFTVTDDKTTVACPSGNLNNTVLFDHFENGSLAQSTFGTPSYVNGLAGFGQAIDFSSGAWLRYNMPGWYQWPSTYNPIGKEGSVDLWVYPKQYGVGFVNFNWSSTDTPPGGGHILHLSLTTEGKLYGGSWSAISGPALIPLPAGNTTIPLNQWSHVAYTWGENGTSLYVNGVQDSFSPDNLYPALNPTFYAYVPYWGYPGIGYIDDLRITSSSQSNFGVSALAEGESITCNGSYIVTQNDVDNQWLTNTAQAYAFFGSAPLESMRDIATVTIGEHLQLKTNFDTDEIQVWGLANGTSIGLNIDGPGVHYSTTKIIEPLPWDSNQYVALFQLQNEFDILPGYIVTVTGNGQSKTMTVVDIWGISIDVDADTVSGYIAAGSSARVHVGENIDSGNLPVDENGYWIADLSLVGTDIGPGSRGYVQVDTEDGGTTWISFEVPNPTVDVRANEDRVTGRGWSLGATVNVTIDDPSTPAVPDISRNSVVEEINPGEISFNLELHGEFDIQPGFVVTASSGGITKTLLVTPLALTDIDTDLDLVNGIAEAGSIVDVWACADFSCIRRHITADGSGVWLADFAHFGDDGDEQNTLNIVLGTWVDSVQMEDDGDQTMFGQNVPNPVFSVHQDEDWLEGYDWPTGVTVNISIDDPSTPQNPDKTGSAVVGTSDWNPHENYFSFELSDIYDIKAGFQVVVSGGGVTKEHEVTNLVVTNVNAADDTVSGTSDPNAHFRVDVYNTNGAQMEIDSDSNGNWIADFTSQYDLKPGDSGRVQEYDDDWDNTGDNWRIPNPAFGARPNEESVELWQWPLGATVTIEIDDPATPQINPDFTGTAIASIPSWNPNETRFTLNFSGQYDLKPGDLVTVTEGNTIKTHTVTGFQITNINIDTDIVSGITNTGGSVDLWICGNNGCVNRNEPVDQNGEWFANFAVPGDEDWEQGNFDIKPGISGDSAQWDEDGDGTVIGWRVPDPIISARPFERQISGYDWPDGALITITIDDPLTTASPDYTATSTAQMQYFGQTEAMFNLIDLFTLKDGHIITMTDSTTTKTHMVTNLAIQSVDVDTDQVFGMADPGHTIQIFVWASQDNATAWRDVTADSNGSWVADFSISMDGMTYDILAETWGETSEYDEDGDNTNVYWRAPNPTFTVYPDDEVIEGNDWPLDSVLTVQIGNPDHPDYTTTTTLNPADQDHNLPWFKLDISSVYDLQPGEMVTAFDAETTKQLIVANRNITLIDMVADTITGIGDQNITFVVLWACDDSGCVGRRKDVTPGEGWSVNFALPGELDWENAILDIQPGTTGGIYQNDEDGDGTSYAWSLNQPPHADLGPDLVTDEGTTLMLDASASSDPEAGLLTYEWDLDNDGEYDDAVGVTTTKSFPDNGNYIISLKVTDEYGASDTDTVDVTVNNISPLVDIQQISAIGLSVSGSGSFTDPGADLWTATVNYGDGSGVQPLALNPDKSFPLNHAYIAGGIYTVEVCISDDDSGSGCDQAQVTVTLNRPPVAEAGGPYFGNEGTSITLNASRSTDPDGNIVRYEWDLDNDGQFDDAAGVKPKFAAIDNGVFTVRVRVTDAGGLSSVDSAKVTVKNVPPVITSLTFNSSVRVGVKLNTYAAFKDVGINDTFTATWKWGDGTTSTGAISGKTVNGSHTYTKLGIYLITITVKDKDGGVGQAYKLIFVLPKK